MPTVQTAALEAPIIPITGRRLTAPAGPIFHLQRSGEADFELGAFRAWAGYKNLGSDTATDGLAHFQHVISFAGTEAAGRTGVHAHFAHAHIVIPTSGRGVFSYDGLVTEATPGAVIVQHGGTVHDQFDYSFAGGTDAETKATAPTIDPEPAGAPVRSFSFLELFVPMTIANVEIIPPEAVTDADQRTAWDHPYHAEGARYSIQTADGPGAAYRPVSGAEHLEARDADTWEPSGHLVATWIIRAASGAVSSAPICVEAPAETGGIDILFMVSGSASFRRATDEVARLEPGDTLTCDQDAVGAPFDASPDMRLVRLFIAERAQSLRERTPAEIAALEALGPRIITRSLVRLEGDDRPVNFLHEG